MGSRNNMKKMLWLIPVVLLCVGCPRTYTHTSKGPVSFEQDRAACERTSRQKLAVKGIT